MKVVNTENSLNSLHSTLNTAQHDINSLSSGLFNASGSISSIQNSVQVVTNSDAAQNVQIATMQSRYESYNTSITLLSTIVKAAFEVRLVGSSSCGRVEVSYVGVWGTICDDAWDINDANVVCRMLGYSSGGRAFSQATYGRGSGKIWLDQVQCDGTESSLWECPKNPIGIHDCGHHEDASVCCVGLLMQHAPIEKPSEWNRMENT
ncbi:scavenger receptor cysteine-rich type 1 protein M130-like [Saccostrea cucullata]|uniref:scavenger receptor cysteine-rich type 1 protein M130-like n=1 Tax=Saccostrea cuccullata TaxID=36930 RepID=UPI002ED54693